MRTDTLPTLQVCRYCGHALQVGESEIGMLPMCEPSVGIGLVYRQCGSVDRPDNARVELEAGNTR